MKKRSRKPDRKIYGLHPVRSALSRAKRGDVRVVLSTSPVDPEIGDLARKRGCEIVIVDRAHLDRMTKGATHQGVVAKAGGFAYGNLETLLRLVDELLDKDEPPLLMVLDQVQDPRNLGAIIRSTLELGGHAVVISEKRSARVTPATAKASAGATEFLPICRVVNISKTLGFLRDAGVESVATVDRRGSLPEQVDLTGPVALVLGSEGKGLRPKVEATCDHRLTIPISGPVGSLNVSVAAGVALSEAARQRRSTSGSFRS